MKCEICGKEIETTFLGKIKGNYIKTSGKQNVVCNSCFKVNHSSVKEASAKKQ
ncbi:MAG: hypothetical protein M1433_01140 [Candidatus Parvarchaeota archaeon]|nr:hypothetical protein [Candidatus Parvarchaeota archaeon]